MLERNKKRKIEKIKILSDNNINNIKSSFIEQKIKKIEILSENKERSKKLNQMLQKARKLSSQIITTGNYDQKNFITDSCIEKINDEINIIKEDLQEKKEIERLEEEEKKEIERLEEEEKKEIERLEEEEKKEIERLEEEEKKEIEELRRKSYQITSSDYSYGQIKRFFELPKLIKHNEDTANEIYALSKSNDFKNTIMSDYLNNIKEKAQAHFMIIDETQQSLRCQFDKLYDSNTKILMLKEDIKENNNSIETITMNNDVNSRINYLSKS